MTRMGRIHAARLSSPRLQRFVTLMRDGQWRTTRQIIRGAGVCAVNAVVSELRHHGAEIDCEQRPNRHGHGRRWFYRMTKGPVG